MKSIPSSRKLLCLFVPLPHNRIIEYIRSKYDPASFKCIQAHVTLCREHEVADWSEVEDKLSALEEVHIPLSFKRPEIAKEGGLFLFAQGRSDEFFKYRKFLLPNDREVDSLSPHITLIHPRTPYSSIKTLSQVSKFIFPQGIIFREIALIEQTHGSSWRVIRRYSGVSPLEKYRL